MGIRNINKLLKENFAPDELRLQGLLKKRKETLKEFLIKFFNKWNLERNTLYVKTNEVQTIPGKRRSFGDIYAICKYYYPDCHVRDIRDILYELPSEVENFRSSPCSQIKKRVFYKGTEDQKAEILNTSTSDEFGMVVQDWLTL